MGPVRRIGLVVVAAALLAACGGGDDDSGEAATGADGGATSTAPPTGGKSAGSTDICKLFPPEKVGAFLQKPIGYGAPSHETPSIGSVNDRCVYSERQGISSAAGVLTERYPNVEAAQAGFKRWGQYSKPQPVAGIGDEAKTFTPHEQAAARFGTVVLHVNIENRDRTPALVERHVAQLREFLRLVAETLQPTFK